jgi:Zn-dependent M32 family carboxypeptidase
MDAMWVAEVMLFNLETAQAFEEHRRVPDTFYKSMLNSFEELVQYVVLNRLLPQFIHRIREIYRKVRERNWPHAESFARVMELAP